MLPLAYGRALVMRMGSAMMFLLPVESATRC
jgi:hypothetical protein